MIDDKFAWRLVLYLVAVVLAHYLVYKEWLIHGPHDFLLVCVMGFYLGYRFGFRRGRAMRLESSN